jgi:hypothetical protein
MFSIDEQPVIAGVSQRFGGNVAGYLHPEPDLAFLGIGKARLEAVGKKIGIGIGIGVGLHGCFLCG